MKKGKILLVAPNLLVNEGELSRIEPPLGLLLFAPLLQQDGHEVLIKDFALEGWHVQTLIDKKNKRYIRGQTDEYIAKTISDFGHRNNKTIVIASDGSPTNQLLPFSKDADILVMHACVPELIQGRFGGNSETARIVASHHATFKEIGEIATNAKVKKLVFSHVVPPLAPDARVIEGISEYFSGEIIAGKDQMVL